MEEHKIANEIEEQKETNIEEDIIESMENYEEEINKGFVKIYKGDIIEGSIISIGKNELIINIGHMSDGIIPFDETNVSSEMELNEVYNIGDIVKAEVIKKDDGEGNILLSIKKAEQILVWEEIEDAFNEDKIIKVNANEIVKGGVICNIKGVRAFIPASLLSTDYIENLSDFIGIELLVKVVEYDKDKKKIILSRKAVEKIENENKKNKLLQNMNKGDKFTGTVKKLMNFGAFVDLGGIDGLIHNNDLSWSKVKHPSEILKEGDLVEVTIIDVDKERERIALSLKNIEDNPWNEINKNYKVNNIYEGEVVKITNYGAFVKIDNGIEGLVHISEISDKRINRPDEVLSIGDKVNVKILNIDSKEQRIKLSIKEATSNETVVEEVNKYVEEESISTNMQDIFKDVLKFID